MDDLLLQKYLRNETSEEELAEVLDWLDASTENQRYLDRLDYIFWPFNRNCTFVRYGIDRDIFRCMLHNHFIIDR